jgi:hypothetical protein
MVDFTFDLPGDLTVKDEAGDEQVAKALVDRAFAHLNTFGVHLTSDVRIVAIETGKVIGSVRQKAKQ